MFEEDVYDYDDDDYQKGIFEEDLYDDRDINYDDVIAGLDLEPYRRKEEHERSAVQPNDKEALLPDDAVGSSGSSGSGCLIFILALPAAIMLLLMLP